jgi:hypothetical protein
MKSFFVAMVTVLVTASAMAANGTGVSCPYPKGSSKEGLCAEQCKGRTRTWNEAEWKCYTAAGDKPYGVTLKK